MPKEHARRSTTDVPEDLARALDESADNLLHDRTEDIGEFLKRMRAKIDAHRAGRIAGSAN